MDLNDYYLNIYNDTEQFLIEQGFKLDSHDILSEKGNVFSGSMVCNGEILDIYLLIPTFFPDQLPRVYLKKKFPTPLPHVDSDLYYICALRETGLLYWTEKYRELITIILEIAKKNITNPNYNDFDSEFTEYWRQDANSTLISLLDKESKNGKVVIAQVTDEEGKSGYIVGNSFDNIQRYFLNSNPLNKIKYLSFGWYFQLNYIPRPPFPKTIADCMKSLVPQSKSEMKKIKKLIPKGQKAPRYVVFSLPEDNFVFASWGGAFINRKHQIKKYNIERYDSTRIQKRIGNDITMIKQNKVCIVGCGSIGSRIAMGLAEAGIEEMLLVDNDILEVGNIARHLCGVSYVSIDSSRPNKKVTAIKKFIENHFPYIKISVKESNILEVMCEEKNVLETYDLIISAVGERTINQRLNMLALSNENIPPIIYSFIEAYGLASHALLINTNNGGCYDCAIDDNLKFVYRVCDFKDSDQFIQEAGCQTTFLPYSSEETKMAASIAVRLALDTLMKKSVKSQHWVWLGDLEEINRLEAKGNKKYIECRSFSLNKYNHGLKRGCSACKKK